MYIIIVDDFHALTGFNEDTLRVMMLNKQIISFLLYRMFNSFVHNTST